MDRNSSDTNSKKFMAKYTIDTVENRGYKILPEVGEIYGPRGGRADNLQFQKGVKYTAGPPRYRQVQLGDKSTEGKAINVKISAHILIWASVNRRWSKEGYVINHINSDRENNRIDNLAEITTAENVRLGRKR